LIKTSSWLKTAAGQTENNALSPASNTRNKEKKTMLNSGRPATAVGGRKQLKKNRNPAIT
jgi:hypothetical protein